jgi:hypothetical protein
MKLVFYRGERGELLRFLQQSCEDSDLWNEDEDIKEALLTRHRRILADLQPQLLGCESDVQCETDNTRRTCCGGGGKKGGKRKSGLCGQRLFACVASGDEQPPQIH